MGKIKAEVIVKGKVDRMQKMSPPFSHIYVEKEIIAHPRTEKILDFFCHEEEGRKQERHIIEITHYKDVFCRKRQDISLQKQAPALILAKKRDHFLYSGSPVCQNFDEKHFYYTSCVMNCLYDCEYCYLQGMYPSGNLVIFVNLEDTLLAVEQMLKKHEVYLCISYDTDLMALENITGFVKEWSEFAGNHKNVKIECRTKCGRRDLWKALSPNENMIFAFTISPEEVVEKFEHRTASLEDRLSCATEALRLGFPVRLCFDPMIYIPDWKEKYGKMLDKVKEKFSYSLDCLYDISIGSFRISQDYLKKIRRVQKNSAVLNFPFENVSGVYQYPQKLMEEMEGFLKEQLENDLPAEKIFFWK